MENKKIELNHVGYEIGKKMILEDVNLCISEGEHIAICGPNGAGKSTLINMMLNIRGVNFRPKTHKFSGEIKNTLFNTKTYQDVKVHLQNSKISYNLYLKVKELLHLCFGKDIPTELLEQFGLIDKQDNLVRSLSGGEFQKLNIILVIASNPKVVFLDEMTTGLDYEARRDILEYVRNYISNNEITLVFVTHYLEELVGLADRICFLKKGRIVEQGNLEQLYQLYHNDNMSINELYEEVIMHE